MKAATIAANKRMVIDSIFVFGLVSRTTSVFVTIYSEPDSDPVAFP
jgi:hypothetical protein